MKDILLTFLVAMVPVVELRGAIPFGVVRGLNLWTAIIASILGNLIPVPFIILFIRKIFAWMRAHMPKLDGLVLRMEKKAEKTAPPWKSTPSGALLSLWPFRCPARARGRARSSRP